MTEFESYLAREAHDFFLAAMPTATREQSFCWVGPCPDHRLFVEQAVAAWPWMQCGDETIKRVNAALVQRLEEWKDEQRRSERVRV